MKLDYFKIMNILNNHITIRENLYDDNDDYELRVCNNMIVKELKRVKSEIDKVKENE